jgi:hypothetical protein
VVYSKRVAWYFTTVTSRALYNPANSALCDTRAYSIFKPLLPQHHSYVSRAFALTKLNTNIWQVPPEFSQFSVDCRSSTHSAMTEMNKTACFCHSSAALTTTLKNHTICHNITTSSMSCEEGDSIASVVIGLLFLVWIGYGLVQAHRGIGYGTFSQRFLQNTFSCCAIDPPEDIERAAAFTDSDMTDEKSRMSMQSCRWFMDKELGSIDRGRPVQRERANHLTSAKRRYSPAQ